MLLGLRRRWRYSYSGEKVLLIFNSVPRVGGTCHGRGSATLHYQLRKSSNCREIGWP